MRGGAGRASAESVRNRRRRVAELIAQRGSISIEEIADETGVSNVTAYRDIGALERQGLVSRTQPGLVSAKAAQVGELNTESRLQWHVKEKTAIAGAAAALIHPGSSVLVDDSSTALLAVRALPDIPLTVVTNSLLVAGELKRKPAIRFLLTGGEYQPQADALTGRAALDMVSTIQADYCLIGAAGISRDDCFHPDEGIAQVKQAMIASAERPMLLVDHSKWQATALHRFASLGDFAEVVVDPHTNPEQLEKLEELGISVVVPTEPICPHCKRIMDGLGADGQWRVVRDEASGNVRRELVTAAHLLHKDGINCPHCTNAAYGFGMG